MDKPLRSQDRQLDYKQKIREMIDRKIFLLTDDSIYDEKPVTPSVFFSDWMKQPLFPLQQIAVNDILVELDNEGNSQWNTKYEEAYLLWGEGCIDGGTLIKDTVTKEAHTLRSWYRLNKSFNVIAYDFENSSFVITKADVPYLKGSTSLYEVVTLADSGKYIRRIVCTKEHKFFTKEGWKQLKDIKEGDNIAYYDHGNAILQIKQQPPWNKNKKWNVLNKQHISYGVKNSVKYKTYLSSDKRKEWLKTIGAKLSEQFRKTPWKFISKGGRCKIVKYKNTYVQGNDEYRFVKLLDELDIPWERCKQWFKYTYEGKEHNYQPDFVVNLNGNKILYEIKGWLRPVDEVKLNAVRNSNRPIVLVTSDKLELMLKNKNIITNHTKLKFTKIVSIKYKKEGDYYDFNVPVYHNYLLKGLLHHNSGKDFTVSRIWTYTIYWLLCLKNPQMYFRLGGDTEPIDLVNVSFDEEQAQHVFFKKFKSALGSVVNPATGKKWFEEKGMVIKETSKAQIIEFPKHITTYSLNSKEYKAEGKNVLMALFDEMAVFKVDKADELYKNLKGSMRSRFPKQHKFIAISYKRDDYDYMMIRWEKTKDNERIYRSGPLATWEVNKLKTREDFNEAYVTDPEDSERRYECKGSTSKGGYFKFKEKIVENINKNRTSPVLDETIPIRDILGIRFKNDFIGKENYKYRIQIDLAKGKDLENSKADCAGFALGHLEPTEEEDKPKVIVDLMMQLKSEPGKEIQFEHIRQLIYDLIVKRNFSIGKVTLDGYQSTDFMQLLSNKGIECELLSVDKDTSAYDTMKGLIYTGRLDYYGHKVFIRECEEVRLINGKVDHPDLSRRRAFEEKDERGSKDVSDAVAGLCKSLIGDRPTTTKWLGMNEPDEENKDGANKREYGDNYKIEDEDDD